ncbi:hypothetical protein BGX34_000580 [Mortierella sp. NVP85]|nr:hypothetical protein BGX34_000580 [Mortierella sp. NVP85]
MLSQNPLEIPEVAALVASYLKSKDLAGCVRVSKSWHDMFLAYRWRAIMRSDEDEFEHTGPSQEAVSNHRRLVRVLYVDGPFKEDKMCTHPNLRKLEIMFDGKIFDWDLAAKTPLLEHLLLSEIEMVPRCLQRLSFLRSLVLHDVTIQDVPGFWEACKHLESLSMYNIRFPSGFVPVPADTLFARLHTLSIGYIRRWRYSQQLAMILHCPKLESFEWNPPQFRVQIWIQQPIHGGRWSPLDNLSIPGRPSDAEWALALDIIGSYLGKFTFLDLHSGTFGSETIKALAPHFSSLVRVHLINATSSAVRDVLCSCPMLENLSASDIFAQDIAEGGVWVCRQLRKLTLCFCFKETEQDLQPVVFERLSALVGLRILDMGGPCNEDNNVLEFRLDCGLAQLASLKELRALGFCHEMYGIEQVQRLGANDIGWMMDNWKNLKGICGCLNRDPEVHARLKDQIEHRGILYGGSRLDFDKI